MNDRTPRVCYHCQEIFLPLSFWHDLCDACEEKRTAQEEVQDA